MKAKYALIALLAITFFGCDDNTGGLGLGMFPGNDQNIKGKLSTFDVTTESVKTGDIYAKTNIGYIGKFTDETFGTYQAGFLAQLNCPDGLTFPEPYKEVTDASGNVISATGRMVVDSLPQDPRRGHQPLNVGDHFVCQPQSRSHFTGILAQHIVAVHFAHPRLLFLPRLANTTTTTIAINTAAPIRRTSG